MTHEAPMDKKGNLLRLTLTGGAFATAGAVMHSYVPAFHHASDWLQHKIEQANYRIGRVPLLGPVHEINPLVNNPTYTQFLAVSTLETVLAGTLILGMGTALGIMGVDRRTLVETLPFLAVLDREHGTSPRH